MIDILALVISHGLLAIAVWRLMLREDLFADDAAQQGRVPQVRKPEMKVNQRSQDAATDD